LALAKPSLALSGSALKPFAAEFLLGKIIGQLLHLWACEACGHGRHHLDMAKEAKHPDIAILLQ